MLEMKNVTKTFGTFPALDDLSLTVPRGAVYGLVGPNGAGKSTAIRLLTGVYRPDSGQITMEGAPIYENPECKTRIGYIPDDIFYFPSASLEEMRKFYRGMYPNFDDALFERLYEVFQLPKKDQIRRFSKGMQKQAAFHLAICTRPDVLILDEPVDGLDPVMRRQVWSLILSDVAQRETTVLISSHNLRELEDICDQDLEVLHESQSGRLRTLIVRGTAEEIRQRAAQMQPAYFDVLPLSLEEIFIYELGGVNYEVKNIVL